MSEPWRRRGVAALLASLVVAAGWAAAAPTAELLRQWAFARHAEIALLELTSREQAAADEAAFSAAEEARRRDAEARAEEAARAEEQRRLAAERAEEAARLREAAETSVVARREREAAAERQTATTDTVASVAAERKDDGRVVPRGAGPTRVRRGLKRDVPWPTDPIPVVPGPPLDGSGPLFGGLITGQMVAVEKAVVNLRREYATRVVMPGGYDSHYLKKPFQNGRIARLYETRGHK